MCRKAIKGCRNTRSRRCWMTLNKTRSYPGKSDVDTKRGNRPFLWSRHSTLLFWIDGDVFCCCHPQAGNYSRSSNQRIRCRYSSSRGLLNVIIRHLARNALVDCATNAGQRVPFCMPSVGIFLLVRSGKKLSRAVTSDVHNGLVGAECLGTADSSVGESSKPRAVVIEDYYCVSVKPSENQDAHGIDREGDTQQQVDLIEGHPADQTASFISEEGPAQWLTAPKQQHHGETLSMESAEETSDSEGERTCPVQRVNCSSRPQESVNVGGTVRFACCAPCSSSFR